jgi:hypothetical protein
MPGIDNLDFGKTADCELCGEMTASEIRESLELLFFSGNRAARKTVRIDAEVRRYLVGLLTMRSGA